MMFRYVMGLVVACAMVLGGCYESTSPAGVGPVPEPGAPPPPTWPGDDAGVPLSPSEGPPPVAGGTMALTADGRVVAADVETDTLFVFEAATGAIRGSVALGDAVEPGRVAVDGAGRAHVLLRRTGELATVDLGTVDLGTSAFSRRDVCAAPRGLAVDGESLWVACAGGELVTLPAAGGAPTRSIFVEPDLRDVIVGDGVLYVSRFRSAELLTLDLDGRVIGRRSPPARESFGGARDGGPATVTMVPNVAYRIRRLPDGRVAMLHQRSASTPIDVETDGYSGGECRTGVVEAAISYFAADGGAATSSGALVMAAVPVDFAIDPAGEQVLVANAGISRDVPVDGVARYPLSSTGEPCHFGSGIGQEPSVAVEVLPDGRAVSLHHGSSTLFAVQRSEGATPTLTPRPAPVGLDRGYELFHMQTVSGVACASCHPEGGEDGHVWDFQPTGPRRTQTLLGGVLETAPFHWDGDQPNMGAIMDVTFTQRMSGFLESAADVAAISAYLDRQPLPAGSRTDADAVARGRSLFEGDAGCASCHAGAALTNGETIDVATGGAFQVPSLRGVWLRAPFFHDGCAPTLGAVLEPGCAGAAGHGDAASLSEAQRADLVAYLRSL